MKKIIIMRESKRVRDRERVIEVGTEGRFVCRNEMHKLWRRREANRKACVLVVLFVKIMPVFLTEQTGRFTAPHIATHLLQLAE